MWSDFCLLTPTWHFNKCSDNKEPTYNAGDLGLTPGSGRSAGEGHGNQLQYSCLENPMEREAWWATVHGVAKSWTRLSDFHTHKHLRLPINWPISCLFLLDFFASLTLLTTLILFPFSLWHYFWFSSLFTVCSKYSPSTSLCLNIDFSFGSALSHLIVSSCSSLVITSSFVLFFLITIHIWQIKHLIEIY